MKTHTYNIFLTYFPPWFLYFCLSLLRLDLDSALRMVRDRICVFVCVCVCVYVGENDRSRVG